MDGKGRNVTEKILSISRGVLCINFVIIGGVTTNGINRCDYIKGKSKQSL